MYNSVFSVISGPVMGTGGKVIGPQGCGDVMCISSHSVFGFSCAPGQRSQAVRPVCG